MDRVEKCKVCNINVIDSDGEVSKSAIAREWAWHRKNECIGIDLVESIPAKIRK